MARKWHGVVWAAVVILVLGALAPAATWAATQTLAISGQSAPGTGGGTFSLFGTALFGGHVRRVGRGNHGLS